MSDTAAAQLAQRLRTLGNSIRLDILRYIVQQDRWIAVSEVVAAIRVAQSTASQYISDLLHDGLIEASGGNGKPKYRARPGALRHFLGDIECFLMSGGSPNAVEASTP